MIVADSSVWIEFLRRTETPADLTLTRLIQERAEIAMTEPVLMEVLAGANPAEADRLRDRLLSLPLLPLQALSDFEQAATIYRACRAGGDTIRSILDCLIAAIALRADAEVLHHDADFDAIARTTGLRIRALDPA